MSEINYNQEGDPHGNSKYWYEDGSLSQSIYMNEGELDESKSSSKVKLFTFPGAEKRVKKFSDGEIEEIAIYNKKSGKRQGSTIMFYEDAGLKKAEVVFNHKSNQSGLIQSLNGLVTEWYDNGIKRYEGKYKPFKDHNNSFYTSIWKYKFHGVSIVNGYDAASQGHPIGVHTWWDEDGNVDRVYNYKKRKASGLALYFHKNGVKKAKMSYSHKYKANSALRDNNSLHGMTTLWNESGMKEYEGKFQAINDWTTSFYPKNHPSHSRAKVGVHTWWNENGTVSKAENYDKKR